MRLGIPGGELDRALELSLSLRVVTQTEIEGAEIDVRLEITGLQLDGFSEGLGSLSLPALHGCIGEG